jgi:hypothetical protein
MTEHRPRSRSISEDWIKKYVARLVEAASHIPASAMRDAILRRVDAITDLMQAWRQRGKT